jgi:hypothetical protein
MMLDQQKLRFIDWLCTAPTERQPATMEGIADELGVASRTLRDWKKRPDFIKEWEKRAVEVAGSPERTQLLLDKLYEVAMDSASSKQVNAAKLFLDVMGAIKPPDVKVTVTQTAEKLSDEELDALIAEVAVGEKLMRGTGSGV